MIVIGQVLGAIILLLWLLLISVGRNYIRTHGSVMYATVFQYHILPLVVGIGLLISGNFWHLPIAIVAWVLSIRFPWFFLHIFPLAAGWAYGSIILSNVFPDSRLWELGGGLIGLVGMFAICSVIVAIVTKLRAEAIPKEQEDAIEDLDKILKCLFGTLLDRYYTTFTTDSKETNRHRAGVVLNELVVKNLRGDQVEFRHSNAEFIDREKTEVMMLEDVRKGVLCFLAAKGGLYQSWGHPEANMWISQARKIDPDVAIPTSLEEVKEAIDRYLVWYQQRV